MGWIVKHFTRHPSLKMGLAIALALASSTAAALGLGQIEVRSRSGQPLLAEIPIVSVDPSELEQLQARLASPETFARVGLQPPQGIVSGLQFAVALDDAGRPVIRVTSDEPVSQPLLTFLIEVDWGQGRLVREYSALIDAPRTVSAPAQPAIEAAVVAAPNVIERPVEAPPAAVDPTAEPAIPAEAVPDTAIAAAPVPMAPVPVEAAAEPAAGSEYLVQRGESLSKIAGQLDVADGYSLDQAMIALLRANPDAFIGGNINQLKQGAILRVPTGNELAAIDTAQATEIVRGQVRQWRDARRPVPQPAAGAEATQSIASASRTSTTAAAPGSGARLEIAPPGASRATRAGTQSGINAGGEGKMLRQELQETKESLAARDAELQELKGRIAELEKLQTDQQQLMSMKDSELAAVQQRLATSQAAAPATQPAAAQSDSVLPWVFGGAGLLMVMLVGGWWIRGRSRPRPVFRAPPSGPSDLASAFPATPAPVLDREPVETAVDVPPSVAPIKPPRTPAPAEARSEPTVTDGALPFWDRRERTQMTGGRVAVAPAWHNGGAARMDAPPAAPLPAAPVGSDRLELAQAYIDLGDRESARQLLGEVAVNGDLGARQQAARMLQELE